MDKVYYYSLKKYLSVFLILFSSTLFIYSLIVENIQLESISVLLTWVAIVVYNLSRSKAVVLAFLSTFFAFLLGEVFVNLFSETRLYDLHYSSLSHSLICLYISLLFLQFGSILGNRIRFRIVNTSAFNGEYQYISPKDVILLRKVTKLMFFVFATCSLLVAIERLINVNSLGSYTASFVDYQSSLPGIITKLDGMTDMVFFLYLATLPDPRHAKSVFASKIVISLIVLLYGTRNSIIMTVLMIVLYCIFFENIHGIKYQIIKKNFYVMCMIALPLVFILFDFIMSFRDGKEYTFEGFNSSLKNIVSSIGGSINVITYGYEFHSILGDHLYSIGNLKNFFTQNVFARALFGVQQYGGNTIELALYGNSYSSSLTYLVNRSAYLSGYGMGSCYIAEVYNDFGYLGVCLINVIYGFILSKFNTLRINSFLTNAVVLMAVNSIFLAPRSYADGFISCFLNFSFILTLTIIYFVMIISNDYF